MDFRQKYADMTGDFERAYAVDESGAERYKYSDATMQRAVEALLGASENKYTYMVDRMETFGPRAGVGFGNLYEQTPEAGVDYFNEKILDAYSNDGMGAAALGVLGAIMQPRPQRFGMIQGLVDYLREAPVRREDDAFERGLLK